MCKTIDELECFPMQSLHHFLGIFYSSLIFCIFHQNGDFIGDKETSIIPRGLKGRDNCYTVKELSIDLAQKVLDKSFLIVRIIYGEMAAETDILGAASEYSSAGAVEGGSPDIKSLFPHW